MGPHGLAGGLLIPHVVRLNADGGYDGFDGLEAFLATQAGPSEGGFGERVRRLFAAIRAPADFGAFRVRRADIPLVIEETVSQRSAVLSANPVPAHAAYLTAVLEGVIPA